MIGKKILSWLTITIMSLVLMSCSSNDTIQSVQAFEDESKPPLPRVEKIAEVSPPKLISQLNQKFAQTKPQVNIISPTNDQVVESQNVEVKLEVEGLDTFKNPELKMGPHLHFFVDDKPYQAVYNTNQLVTLSDLTPGTHTIRVFASRPWHESFKNRGAYATTTFHVFTKTEENNPSSTQPLLTYSRPQGVYNAEPIMLDFYLTDAPLHVVAQDNPDDEITDWRIRVTVNGESFLLDRWQPIYLEGFNEGQNWIKLEYIDENGDLVKNVFNSTVRAITFNSQSEDTLAKLVTGNISLEKAQAIINPENETLTEVVTQPIETKTSSGNTDTTQSTIPEEIKTEVAPKQTQPIIPEEIETEVAPEEEAIIEQMITPEVITEDNPTQELLEEVEIDETIAKQNDLPVLPMVENQS